MEPGPGASVVFTGIELLKAGGLSLTVRGTPGQSFSVEGSADLKTWNSQGTIVLTSDGLASYSDTLATFAGMRFYRLRSTGK